MRIQLACGQLDAAQETLQQLMQLPILRENPYQQATLASVVQVQLWLARGELDRAIRWAENVKYKERIASPLACEREEVASVRVLLAQQRAKEALILLESLQERAGKIEQGDHVIEIHLLTALAHWMSHTNLPSNV